MKNLFQNKLLNTFIRMLIFGGLMLVLYKQLFGNEKIDIAYEHFLPQFSRELPGAVLCNTADDGQLGHRKHQMEIADRASRIPLPGWMPLKESYSVSLFPFSHPAVSENSGAGYSPWIRNARKRSDRRHPAAWHRLWSISPSVPGLAVVCRLLKISTPTCFLRLYLFICWWWLRCTSAFTTLMWSAINFPIFRF